MSIINIINFVFLIIIKYNNKIIENLNDIIIGDKSSTIINNIYDYIVWINKNVFDPLNRSVRIDAFIGIISVLIAIVIFIAETMNDKKIETQKRFILEKTKMKKIMTFSIIILSLCILKEITPYDEECSKLIEIIFFAEELIINIFMFCSIWLTIKLFCTTIKLNTNSDYFSKEYDKYIKERLIIIHNKNVRFSNKKLKNESLKKFINDNEKYFSIDLDDLEGYTPIKANKSGIFKFYSCRSLQAIADKIDEDNRKEKELKVYREPLILLNLKGGEKINRGVTIAYCKNDFLNYEESIRNSCIFNDSIPFQDNEINLIINDLFLLAETNIDNDFDSDLRLFNFYDFLYKNGMRSLLDISYEYIRKIYIKYYKDVHKNQELANFLTSLASLAYFNEDYERYKYLNDYIYFCYSGQLEYTNDIRETSFNFTNSLFRYDYYSIKKNSDSIYYDVLISNLLNFLFDLIMRKQFNAIKDLFDNVIFDYNGFIDGEPDSYDIIKIQFSFGFIYGLMVLSNENTFDDDDKEDLKEIVNYIRSNFVDVYSQNEAINYFLKYYNLNSNVHSVYYNFNFKFVNKEYKNSWSGIHIDDVFILKGYIFVFGIGYSNTDDINHILISKDNKLFYERLLESLETQSKLESLLDISMNKDSLKKLLEALIKKCKKAESEYIKNNEISTEKTDSFKNTIFKEIEKGNELISYLKENNKYSIVSKRNKRILGFNQIIGRDLFFDNVYTDYISSDYGRAILTGIAKNYLKKLDSISKVINDDLANYVSNLNKKDEYVIITSPSNWKILNLNNYNDKSTNISGKMIDIIMVPKIRDIYLIKKKDLPKIELFEPDITESGTYENGVYYNLTDCSTNASARTEIQKNTKWLAEKGNVEEQIEYLKGKCVFKLFISPSIRKNPNSKCYKFVVKEGDE